MQVIVHAGVHCTDNDALLKTLRRNVETLRKEGVIVPGPGKYRRALTDILNSLAGTSAKPGARDVMIDQILDGNDQGCKRLVLSHPNLFCVPKILFNAKRAYTKAEKRLGDMQDLFQGDTVELFLCLRDPATFLPSVFETTPHTQFSDLMNGVDPMDFRWSQVILRIHEAMPDLKMTIWCHEDTPLIWSEVMCRMAGLPIDTTLDGAYDVFESIMDKDGMQKFMESIESHPDLSLTQMRKIMVSFLDRYADQEALEQEIDIPGWDDAYIRKLSDLYDDDVDLVASIPGVTFIDP